MLELNLVYNYVRTPYTCLSIDIQMLFIIIFKTNWNALIPLKTSPKDLKSEIYVQGYMVKECLLINSCL